MDKRNSLTPDVQNIVLNKGTEPPFSGQYQTIRKQGSYLCRRCGLALFRANNQFTSQCGWPSFDDQLPQTIREAVDADGRRTEILCQRCDAHLGHVFNGEQLTLKNKRHCVNTLAIEFVESDTVTDTQEAIIAAGCFWGVEHLLARVDGVLKTEVGYTGGHSNLPTYQQVCRSDSGHYEAVRVVFDNEIVDFTTIIKHFFEIHDPSQVDGQGNDRAQRYKSAVFFYDDAQKQIVTALIQQLADIGLKAATTLHPVSVFWPAEKNHQHYYDKTGGQPYCHRRTNRFNL